MTMRFSLIYFSFILIGLIFAVNLSGAWWGLPLDYEKGQNIQLLQIGLPTFMSYLSNAAAYAIAGQEFPEPTGERGKILKILLNGGIILFLFGYIFSTCMFYLASKIPHNYNNFSFEYYSHIITILISILGITTTAVSTYIFSANNRKKK